MKTMNIPHKHAALIIAWANGAAIECQNRVTKAWGLMGGPGDELSPAWLEDFEYRIKPDPLLFAAALSLIKEFMDATVSMEWSQAYGTADDGTNADTRFVRASNQMREFIIDLEQKVLANLSNI